MIASRRRGFSLAFNRRAVTPGAAVLFLIRAVPIPLESRCNASRCQRLSQ